MKQFFAAATFVLFPASTAWADVDTLECNSAAAIRISYVEAVGPLLDSFVRSLAVSEFCLVRDAPATVIEIGGYPVSLRYVGQRRTPEIPVSALAAMSFSSEIVFTPDDQEGRSFLHHLMVQKPYDPETDSDWRYTPLQMVLTAPTKFIVGGNG